MGRHTTSTSYVTPKTSAGDDVAVAPGADATVTGRGVHTLTAGATYYFPLGGQDAPVLSAHLQHDAAIALVATIEDSNFPEDEASWYASTAGLWIDEDPSTAFVGVVGATTTVTNGVVTVVAGNVGGAMWHISDTGARRTRLKVVVGGTGGEVRCATWGKA